jgi:hypothetical protein
MNGVLKVEVIAKDLLAWCFENGFLSAELVARAKQAAEDLQEKLRLKGSPWK